MNFQYLRALDNGLNKLSKVLASNDVKWFEMIFSTKLTILWFNIHELWAHKRTKN